MQRHQFTALNSVFIVDAEYEFVKELGQGAYGCVVAARHRVARARGRLGHHLFFRCGVIVWIARLDRLGRRGPGRFSRDMRFASSPFGRTGRHIRHGARRDAR